MAAQLAGTALALVFVLALAWLALRGLKRLQQRAGGSSEADAPLVLHSQGLGPRERLVTVHWRGRDYLLGVTAGSVTFIDHRASETVAPTPPVH
jgi:flagellar biogenesis protein FliO